MRALQAETNTYTPEGDTWNRSSTGHLSYLENMPKITRETSMSTALRACSRTERPPGTVPAKEAISVALHQEETEIAPAAPLFEHESQKVSASGRDIQARATCAS